MIRMTVGKKMITMNIALVITVSLVSPYQPSPPWETPSARAAGAVARRTTTKVRSAVAIRARRIWS